ncbi:MAG TPA: hypothetical protein VM076_07535 [Gemmatimonadaceae bacterium]|nr:hypothetical protein [Gemmatimonadaceae bacterium]
MTSLESRTDPHADAETLTRLIDGQPLEGERDAVAHAGACETCQARIEVLRQRRARLTDLLMATDASPIPLPDVGTVMMLAQSRTEGRAVRLTPRRPGRRAMIVGAFIVSGAALAAQPVTRWVMARWRDSAASEPQIRSTVPVAPPNASPASIAFVPQTSEIVIGFDAVPASGTLMLRRGAGTRVSASITSGAREEGFIVLPNGVGVRNSATSVASYEVVIPASVDRVQVRIGTGSESRTVDVRLEAGGSRQIPLRR